MVGGWNVGNFIQASLLWGKPPFCFYLWLLGWNEVREVDIENITLREGGDSRSKMSSFFRKKDLVYVKVQDAVKMLSDQVYFWEYLFVAISTS